MDTLMILKNDSNQRWTKFWYRKYSILIVEKFDNENSTFRNESFIQEKERLLENQGILHDWKNNLVQPPQIDLFKCQGRRMLIPPDN